jgi:hypothetical protein
MVSILKGTQQQYLRLSPTRAPAAKATRQDPRVVEHEQVAGLEVARQLANLAVVQALAGRIQYEHASRIAL